MAKRTNQDTVKELRIALRVANENLENWRTAYTIAQTSETGRGNLSRIVAAVEIDLGSWIRAAEAMSESRRPPAAVRWANALIAETTPVATPQFEIVDDATFLSECGIRW